LLGAVILKARPPWAGGTGEVRAETDAYEPPATGSSRSGSGRRLSSRDIARAAGVSQATVSNVLNRPERVAPATLQRVHDAMRKANFVVNHSARSLREGRSRTLGVVALDMANPYWGEVTRGISAAASTRGYSVLLGSSEESREEESDLLRVFKEHRVDGVLVSSIDLASRSLRDLDAHDIRTVLLDRTDPSEVHSSVSFDQVAGARMVAEYLVALGHRRIGFVTVPHDVWWSGERSAGLRAGVESGGLDPDEVVTEEIIATMTARDAEPAVDRLLRVAPGITAVFCANDMIALGVLKQLSVRGVAVPGDLSLVGFDDDYFSELLAPGLTTVRQQPYRLGYRAAELAIQGGAPEQVIFEPELMVRDSVRRR